MSTTRERNVEQKQNKVGASAFSPSHKLSIYEKAPIF